MLLEISCRGSNYHVLALMVSVYFIWTHFLKIIIIFYIEKKDKPIVNLSLCHIYMTKYGALCSLNVSQIVNAYSLM